MTRPMQRLLPLLLLAWFALGAAPTSAADATHWYDVEVIIFQQQPLDTAGEIFPADPGVPALEGARRLLRAAPALMNDPNKAAFHRLPADAYRLNGRAASLARSKRFHPILHLAWRQPVGDPKQAPAVLIDSRRNGADDGRPAVVGTIKVSLQRYLHLDADLLFGSDGLDLSGPPPVAPPAATPAATPLAVPGNDDAGTAPAPAAEPPTRFRMRQSRRLRSGELNYFDHPAFGMLVQITPVAMGDAKP